MFLHCKKRRYFFRFSCELIYCTIVLSFPNYHSPQLHNIQNFTSSDAVSYVSSIKRSMFWELCIFVIYLGQHFQIFVVCVSLGFYSRKEAHIIMKGWRNITWVSFCVNTWVGIPVNLGRCLENVAVWYFMNHTLFNSQEHDFFK